METSEVILACVYFALLAVALQTITTRVCARHSALRPWRGFLQIVAFVWLAVALVKKVYIDEIFPPSDGLMHEEVARTIADLLTAGRFGDAISSLTPGNPAYQFMLGVFYAVTRAPEMVTYAVNGTFGFCGLLILLDVLSRQTNCSRMPASVVIIVSLLPSGMLWTTANLKEGPVLWGICAMCCLTVPAERIRGRPRRVLPMLGLLTVTALRPHIAVAWLAAIGAGGMVRSKRFGLLVASAVGTAASLAFLSVASPAMFEQAVGEGVTATLTDFYEHNASRDSGGATLSGGIPIPVVRGLELILFRPWPTEAREFDVLLAGLEIWVLALFGLLNWKVAGRKTYWSTHSGLVTSVVALLLLAFFFSYLHNMGLAVRQRLMCFPAVLTIYTWPLLAKQRVIHRFTGPRQQRQLMTTKRYTESSPVGLTTP